VREGTETPNPKILEAIFRRSISPSQNSFAGIVSMLKRLERFDDCNNWNQLGLRSACYENKLFSGQIRLALFYR
jgi:hypothetical protein